MVVGKTIKKDFPFFQRKIHGKPIVYLDSAATALKPKVVIDAVENYYMNHTANVFRGMYTTAEEATVLYETARKRIAKFIGSRTTEEIIFTKNTTESLNLIAYSYVPFHVRKGDHIATTIMEHHSNFVLWQQYGIQTGACVDVIDMTGDGTFELSKLSAYITNKTKIFAFSAASNVLGVIVPVKAIVKKVKQLNPDCLVVVDAAQAVPHMPVDVTYWGADAVAFSGHKMLGPSGVGVLWMKKEYLETMKPFLYGGDMIRQVHKKTTEFAGLPHRFEAGTPCIEGVIGLGAAVSYLEKLGMDSVQAHEQEIMSYALDCLLKIPGVTIYGPLNSQKRSGVVSFTVKRMHPHDVAYLLNKENICVRAGYHCAMPLHEYLGISASIRASFYVYSTKQDVDRLVYGIQKAKKILC